MAALLALVACSPAARATAGGHPEVHGLVEVGRVPIVATALAFASDGRRWLAAGDHDLIVLEGDHEVARFADLGGNGLPVTTTTAGGWVVGGRILAADGKVRFDGYSWAHRFGRFGSVHGLATSPDGRVAIAAAHDSPSTCLCDRDRHTGGSWAGGLVRLTFGEGAPAERKLLDHAGQAEYAVAASADSIAAVGGDQLQVWPVRGDAAPIVVTVPPGLGHLAWIDDRYLVATRFVDVEHDEVVVLDRAAKFASTSFVADGSIKAFAVRPGGHELALVVSRYRARATVEVDEKALEVVDLAGARHARVELGAYPLSVAWSPDGETVLASVSPPGEAVIRYAVH